jgi:hypothetical protein
VTTAETESIAADLAGAVEALALAEQQAAAAAEQAGQVIVRAAGTGFQGVATAMVGIRDQITTIRGALANAAMPGQDAATAVRAVGDQSSPTEANGHLSTAMDKLDTMRKSVVAIGEQTATVMSRVEAALHGGQPGPLLARLDGIRQQLATTNQRTDAIRTRIAATIARGGQLGN